VVKITNYGDNPRKKLLAVTLVAVLSIVAVVSVYAVFIGTFTGQDVTVKGLGGGSLVYSSNNADPWTTTLTSEAVNNPWYSRLETNSGGYAGPVAITWRLEKQIDASNWENVSLATTTTNMVLNGTGGYIYATSGGVWSAGNYNWGANVTGGGTYRVLADVESE
jgi:hypothetical protein